MGFENEDQVQAKKRENDKMEYREMLLQQMEVNKINKEKLKVKNIEDEMKEELKYYKNQSFI